MITERENAFLALNFKKPEWVPVTSSALYAVGFGVAHESGPCDPDNRLQRISGYDDWGVRWIVEDGEDVVREPFPAPDAPLLEDICDWREVVKFPDLDAKDWEGGSKWELKDYKGDQIIYYFDTEGMYNRLTDLMGIENALCAMATDPDECYEFFSAVADHKIKLIELVAKWYKPDIFSYMEDIASARGLFFSPKMYRELMKPHHARVIKAIRDNGMLAEQHCCGRMDEVVDDFVEIGVQILMPMQAQNDVLGVQKRYAGKVVISGGCDSQGPAFVPGASDQDGYDEAHRVIDALAPLGGFLVNPPPFGYYNPGFFNEVEKYAHEYYKK